MHSAKISLFATLVLGVTAALSLSTDAVADGQRILGKWTNGWWYPARVVAARAGVYDLVFDDGDRLSVRSDGIGRFDWQAGSQIQCRSGGSGAYTDVTVAMINGSRLMVGYPNGEHENTRVDRCRSRSAGSLQARTGYSKYQRVMAQWSNGWWYPARISGWNSEVYFVRFEDGDSANLRPNQISGRVWGPGSRVQCKWQGGKTYFDGAVAAANGTSVRIHYDDGDREDTHVGYCRSKTATGHVAGRSGGSTASSGSAGEDIIDSILGIIGDGIVEGLTGDSSSPAPQPRSAPAPGYSVPGVPSHVYESSRGVPSDPESFLKAIEDNSR